MDTSKQESLQSSQPLESQPESQPQSGPQPPSSESAGAPGIRRNVALSLTTAMFVLVLASFLAYSADTQDLNVDTPTTALPTSISTRATSIMNESSSSDEYTELQLEAMIYGNAAEQKVAAEYILLHPESIHPFYYAAVVNYLMNEGNIAQATFWFYIFQSRTLAWVSEDPDGYASLRSSLNHQFGTVLNGWAGSDLQAWHDLAARAISYEKTFPFYIGKVEGFDTDTWNQVLEEKREEYGDGFTSSFKSLLEDPGSFEKNRKSNGLYLGPWDNQGEPLPEHWK